MAAHGNVLDHEVGIAFSLTSDLFKTILSGQKASTNLSSVFILTILPTSCRLWSSATIHLWMKAGTGRVWSIHTERTLPDSYSSFTFLLPVSWVPTSSFTTAYSYSPFTKLTVVTCDLNSSGIAFLHKHKSDFGLERGHGSVAGLKVISATLFLSVWTIRWVCWLHVRMIQLDKHWQRKERVSVRFITFMGPSATPHPRDWHLFYSGAGSPQFYFTNIPKNWTVSLLEISCGF